MEEIDKKTPKKMDEIDIKTPRKMEDISEKIDEPLLGTSFFTSFFLSTVEQTNKATFSLKINMECLETY